MGVEGVGGEQGDMGSWQAPCRPPAFSTLQTVEGATDGVVVAVRGEEDC